MDHVTVGFPCALVGEAGENEDKPIELRVVFIFRNGVWDFDSAYFEHKRARDNTIVTTDVGLALFNYLISDETFEMLRDQAEEEALAGGVR